MGNGFINRFGCVRQTADKHPLGRKIYGLKLYMRLDEKTVVIQDNLKPGDHLIISDLSAPVQDMAIRIAADRLFDDSTPAPAAAGADRKAPNG